MIPKYEEVLRNANGEAKRAYQSWRDQGQRCSNKKCLNFKYYGAKNIKRLYSSREFVGWWIEQQKLLNLKKPNVSRIDHNKNYTFDNIKLEESSDNTKEVHNRLGYKGPWPKKKVIITKKDGSILVANSLSEASKIVSYDASTIAKICNGKKNFIRNRTGCSFKYEGIDD